MNKKKVRSSKSSSSKNKNVALEIKNYQMD